MEMYLLSPALTYLGPIIAIFNFDISPSRSRDEYQEARRPAGLLHPLDSFLSLFNLIKRLAQGSEHVSVMVFRAM
jgi:hypothetical protein